MCRSPERHSDPSWVKYQFINEYVMVTLDQMTICVVKGIT